MAIMKATGSTPPEKELEKPEYEHHDTRRDAFQPINEPAVHLDAKEEKRMYRKVLSCPLIQANTS